MTTIEEAAPKLRAPFPTDAIGKLPRVTCGNCSRDKMRKHCDQHQRAKCGVCSSYISTAHMHLDYVGHAAITDRLLQVDPSWTWEPLAFTDQGLPAFDREGGLWIRLTVAGVSRLGYGDAEGKAGPSAVKEAIGDALRNGAMRFGVGLDLWHKDGPLVQEETPAAPPAVTAPNGQQKRPPPDSPPVAREALEELAILCTAMGYDRGMVAKVYADVFGGADIRKATDPLQVQVFIDRLDDIDPARLKPAAVNGAAQ